VEKLPVSHERLLRYLMVVLRRVCDNAGCNEMTAYNVAACTAQCLLWPATDVHNAMSSDQRLTAAKRLIELVRKMIDGAYDIFGSDCLPFLAKSELSSELSKSLCIVAPGSLSS